MDGHIHVPIAKPHNLNVTLSSETHDKLNRLAHARGLNKSVVVRQLIDFGYQMSVQLIPVCASGGRCYVPQHHPPPATSPHQEPIPQAIPPREVPS